MSRLVVQMGMSLDGYVSSDRQHPGTAVPEDDELVAWKLDRVRRAGAHLMGRVTYEEMARYWPTATGPYAAPMNDVPKVVFSKTLTEATWPVTRIAAGELAEEVAAVKAEPGPDLIAYGGATFAAALAAQNLVDEYCLVVQPVAVGAGGALFAELAEPQPLELVEARGFACGSVGLVYRPRTAGTA